MARTHLRRLPLVGFVAVVLLAAGCSLPVFDRGGEGDRTRPKASSGAGPNWKPCPEVPRKLVGRGAANMRYDCATISVPGDWNAGGAAGGSGGDKVEIALLRIRSSKQQDRIGSLLVNPGGPGGSGVDSAVYLSFGAAFGGLPDDVTRRFDIVGFDPRGVSRSSPVKCVPDADLDATFGFEPDPESQADFDELVALNRKIGAGCGEKYGDRLRLFSTEQAARDMDAIRTAVGDEKLSYLGYSYGTLLGATYAQLFPRNVRAFVLDGAVDPKQDMVAGSESQAKGFERAFTNFTDWCERTPGRCPIAPDARTAVTEAIEKARVSPVRDAKGREATPGWIFYAVISSLYTEAGWEKLAAAIDTLADGNPKGTFELADAYAERDADGKYTNLFDANLAVNCADEETKVGVDRIRTLQSDWRKKYPLFGAPLATGMLSCEFWPGQRDPYPTGPATGAPPIVVVGTTGDPATPYEQTPKLAEMLDVGVVLTWQGEGHTAYPQTRCITNAVDAYLIDLQEPREGTSCPAR
ncbi:alpha/beta hydrolase [Plantactinospora soyae]|uniref:Pimeloyl-ACP methyl ester carboxylesterase n=1 Tax=Plantactinospora soyae TaxID=1544732 RepID=A0A927MA67_9ACTN|nr:alpha/beta hydrolase [Plantactinospora soyae]MBE1488108.1 pimeloyl-ACP methyl ester carboxylesterase [Plantactinospora soyae]